jgi:hypothetical protein
MVADTASCVCHGFVSREALPDEGTAGTAVAHNTLGGGHNPAVTASGPTMLGCE